jgi:hypothetical protein
MAPHSPQYSSPPGGAVALLGHAVGVRHFFSLSSSKGAE